MKSIKLFDIRFVMANTYFYKIQKPKFERKSDKQKVGDSAYPFYITVLKCRIPGKMQCALLGAYSALFKSMAMFHWYITHITIFIQNSDIFIHKTVFDVIICDNAAVLNRLIRGWLNTYRSIQYGRHASGDIFMSIFSTVWNPSEVTVRKFGTICSYHIRPEYL